MIDYRVELADLHGHQFQVTLTVARPAPDQQVSLPVWINGSYMVRDFARHLSGLQARQGRRPVAVTALDKSRWQLACSGPAALVLRYRVYAFDASVRAAYLDAARGFFNASSLCLRVHGHEQAPHRLALGRLPAQWQVATAMAADPAAPQRWLAADYAELLDHPFELGRFWRGHFEAGGVPHTLVVSGALPGFDGERLLADARRICAAQIAFWHGPGQPPPFKRYVFLLHAVGDGYGGLEHRDSSALVAARRDLPQRAQPGRAEPASDGHVTLLGLISHEYFHAWNVKRLVPADLRRPDPQVENPTHLLWFFEGFTSYYDDLMLLRCGLIDAPRYLRLLAKTLNAVAATPGRQVQSVAAASFDAWTKYYRPDEQTPNSTVSYYQKGALVALALDLSLRQHGASLDDVMRGLWQRCALAGAGVGADEGADEGADHGAGAGAVTEADIAAVVAAVARQPLPGWLADWVHGTDELPLADLLADFGIELRPERQGLAATLGLRLSEGVVSGVQVKSVLAGGAAHRAGVAAGDELLAVDGWRVRRLDEAQAWLARDTAFELLLVRDQRVLRLRVDPLAGQPPAELLSLLLLARPPAAAARRRRAWLGA